ncbi:MULTISPECIES: hypothetical protein [Bacteroides]|jgi:hypothetical protein|uniref:Uncharacterized protein n=1 Tax=Bacteroides graminisolvens DSM 19988 = JCM 15093 TaxID=1121097 RepID=A0A069D5W1_9BACE|nr:MULTISPECIES: hypothetical protein [Bacteroides]GAK37807.1 hypothetical protein JCM15093_3086 [Bacteroides graminisolvens DSM 19988 = JCM 15093]DAX32113.1 MAG TPA: DNA-directed RNA polymerase [Caudoviricetes sp.]
MNRKLVEDLHQYFEKKDNKNASEVSFLNQLTEELPYFQITAISREDLTHRGFDVDDVDDEDMRELAQKMESDYCEQLFWQSMEIIASEGLEIPKFICPKCGKGASTFDSQSEMYDCHSCDHSWKFTEPTGRYVLVKYPEDSKFFSDCEVGYDSYNSEDNGAMYVPEHFYTAHTGTEPDANKLFIPVTWPESQEYFELQYEKKSIFELCESIEYGKAFDDFSSQAIWVPLSVINKQ